MQAYRLAIHSHSTSTWDRVQFMYIKRRVLDQRITVLLTIQCSKINFTIFLI